MISVTSAFWQQAFFKSSAVGCCHCVLWRIVQKKRDVRLNLPGGGAALEVFTTKGRNPLEKWKVFGGSKNITRGYDRESKGWLIRSLFLSLLLAARWLCGHCQPRVLRAAGCRSARWLTVGRCSYVYEIAGGAQSKIQLPADDRKHTLRLRQPFLVLQVL